jgi:Zn-dependent metalloprotease
MNGSRCRCIGCVMPPYILKKLLESKDRDIREAALNTLLSTSRLRGERTVRSFVAAATPTGAEGRRTIFDCAGGTDLSRAKVIHTEQGGPSSDESANRAFDGFGKTRDFYKKVFNRNSIDDHGMRLDGYVHRGRNFNNAFWDGQEMVFGDGDGQLFTDFTLSLDVYHTQSGALNESISDVFGSLVKQWSRNETAAQADWLIGAEIFTPDTDADALRSMKAPGTAYSNDTLGKDPQPDNMSRFEVLSDDEWNDFGGVHINSGIPNKAFYLTAITIGGYAWEAPGQIWYEALKASGPKTQFQDFADTTVLKAGQLYGANSSQQRAVLDAWRGVGIRVVTGGSAGGQGPQGVNAAPDSVSELVRQLQSLSDKVAALSDDVAAIRKKR